MSSAGDDPVPPPPADAADAVAPVAADPEPLDLREHLIELRPVDIAEALEDWSVDQLRMILQVLPDQTAASVIAEAEVPLAHRIIEAIDHARIPRIVSHLDPDDAADVLGWLESEIPSAPDATDVLAKLEPEDRAPIEELLRYAPDTAGGLMTPNFVRIDVHGTMDSALAAIRAAADIAETVAYVYVLDESERLAGVISVRDLLRNPGTRPVAEVMSTDVLALGVDDPQDAVATEFERHNLHTMPVRDADGRMVGVITVDDVLDVVHESAERNMLAMSGVPLTHQTLAGLRARVLSRLPWLLVTMLSGLAIVWVLSDYEGLITRFAILAFFQPVVLGLGGNIGLQSSTIIVRGLAIDEIGHERMGKVAVQELCVGLSIGAACGSGGVALTALLASFIAPHDPTLAPWSLGIVVGISIFSGMTFATMIGTMVPLLLARARVDPALASGPFFTLLSDLSSLLIYFGTATALLLGE